MMILKYANIKYRREPVKIRGTKPIEKMTVFSEVERISQTKWISTTYKKFYESIKNDNSYKNKLLAQLVIESDFSEEVFYFSEPTPESRVVLNEIEQKVKLSCHKDSNGKYYYYEQAIFQPVQGFRTDKFESFYSGHSSPGTVSILKQLKNDKRLAENVGTITFEPSSLTIREYEEMLKDLYNVHKSLIISDGGILRTGIRKEYSINSLTKEFKKIKKSIESIVLNGNSNLIISRTLLSRNRINKFSPNLEMKKEINPQNDSLA